MENPRPSADILQQIVPTLFDALYCDDIELLEYALKSIQFLSIYVPSVREFILWRGGLFERLAHILENGSSKMKLRITMIYGNLVNGSEKEVQQFIDERGSNWSSC